MKFYVAVAFILATVQVNNALAAGDAAAGEAASAICAACHGADGNSVVPQWPKIAGQHEAYLNRHITLIRDGGREAPEMAPMVSNLTDQQIADLSAYFASQTLTPGVADPDLVEAGAALYQYGNAETGVPACNACHGPAGLGNPLAGFPVISGQHSVYTSKMLTKYRAAEGYDDDDGPSQIMIGVAKALTDDEILAISSYLEGLHEVTE